MDNVIEYQCSVCLDEGLVHGWQGTYFDQTGLLDADHEANLHCSVTLEEFEHARKLLTLSEEGEAILHGAVYANDSVILAASLNDLEFFSNEIAAHANHSRPRRVQSQLDSLWGKLVAAMENAR
jgi:hypothetical protein